MQVMRLSYKYIWGTVMISDLQLYISSINKQQENLAGKLFKEPRLIFLNGISHSEYMEY